MGETETCLNSIVSTKDARQTWCKAQYLRIEKQQSIRKQPLFKEILEGNVLERTVKNADYLPQWRDLQHEVHDRLYKIIP